MIIVDTSVAFKWFSIEEGNRTQAVRILDAHLSGKEPIVVPDLFFYELANAWATKTALPPEQIHEYLASLQSFELKVSHLTIPLLTQAADLAKRYQVSVYDASYAVLAKEKGCLLITADERFARQIQLPYVTLLA
jgi:predicted nucleic acid-binding protein